MSSDCFSFKQFKVRQTNSAMKVGVDGVLLGAWTEASSANKILDVGCGTGLLALMMAQKAPNARIVAIDISDAAAEEADYNARQSPWNNIEVVCADFKIFSESCNVKFDLIISNPPYFSKSLKNPNNVKAIARHDKELGFDDLLKGVEKLLAATGRFACILPSDAKEGFLSAAANYKLFPEHITDVSTVEGKVARRCMMSFCRSEVIPATDTLFIMHSDHKTYGSDYINLTRDFYLWK